jgi:hypothetical protein
VDRIIFSIRVYPPKLGVLGLSFAITGEEKKSQDENNTQWKKRGINAKKEEGTKLVFLT